MIRLSDTLGGVIALARRAGEATMAHYRTGAKASSKSDGSPCTEADRASHEIIVRGLAELTPDVPVISEEGDVLPYEVRLGWSRFWLVDSLDGTKEFLANNGEFTVNIALIEEGEPVLGVVFAPALNVLYAASREAGAWRHRHRSIPRRIFRPERPAHRALTVVESRSHGTDEIASHLPGARIGLRLKLGSSLKFCLVADGTADVYVRPNPTMEWDVAAGDCIYRYASVGGGRNRSPLRYNKPELRNDGFVLGF
jgi:3'(2'), 5'-bisphosphate nucleotidase